MEVGACPKLLGQALPLVMIPVHKDQVDVVQEDVILVIGLQKVKNLLMMRFILDQEWDKSLP